MLAQEEKMGSKDRAKREVKKDKKMSIKEKRRQKKEKKQNA